jgi:hypothetical protein
MTVKRAGVTLMAATLLPIVAGCGGGSSDAAPATLSDSDRRAGIKASLTVLDQLCDTHPKDGGVAFALAVDTLVTLNDKAPNAHLNATTTVRRMVGGMVTSAELDECPVPNDLRLSLKRHPAQR